MYQIGICDDEAAERGYLAGLVEQWAEERGHQVRLWEFSSAENFLFCYEEHRDLHILLLDIEMQRRCGGIMMRCKSSLSLDIRTILPRGMRWRRCTI